MLDYLFGTFYPFEYKFSEIKVKIILIAFAGSTIKNPATGM
jgi:hypothetical protein